MVIIHGHKSRPIALSAIHNVCSNCSNVNALGVVFGRYFHIFGIPTVPFRKLSQIVCSNCKKLTEEKDFNFLQTQKLRALKAGARFPIWFYTGLILIALLVARQILFGPL